MRMQARVWVSGAVMLALGMGLVVADRSSAGGDKATADAIQKIADQIKKGDNAGAKKAAETLAKKLEELHDAMHLFKPRSKGGIGVGSKAGAVTPDGIELKLIGLGRDAPTAAALNKEADALERMAYITAAIGEITLAKPPAKFTGKQNKKDWMEWTKDMQESSLKLAQAAKAKVPSDVKTAAAKVNAACNSCHSVFR